MNNQRPKLDLEINRPLQLELAYDSPLIGENRYGEYYCYTLVDSKGQEFSWFAPLKIHTVLKDQVKGAKIKLVKTAVEKNKKLIQDFSVEVLSPGKVNGNGNGKVHDQNNTPSAEGKNDGLTHMEIMKQCFAEAAEIQKEYNAANLSNIAVTLYISKTKLNGNNLRLEN